MEQANNFKADERLRGYIRDQIQNSALLVFTNVTIAGVVGTKEIKFLMCDFAAVAMKYYTATGSMSLTIPVNNSRSVTTIDHQAQSVDVALAQVQGYYDNDEGNSMYPMFEGENIIIPQEVIQNTSMLNDSFKACEVMLFKIFGTEIESFMKDHKQLGITPLLKFTEAIQNADDTDNAWSEDNWPLLPGFDTRYQDNVGFFIPYFMSPSALHQQIQLGEAKFRIFEINLEARDTSWYILEWVMSLVDTIPILGRLLNAIKEQYRDRMFVLMPVIYSFSRHAGIIPEIIPSYQSYLDTYRRTKGAMRVALLVNPQEDTDISVYYQRLTLAEYSEYYHTLHEYGGIPWISQDQPGRIDALIGGLVEPEVVPSAENTSPIGPLDYVQQKIVVEMALAGSDYQEIADALGLDTMSPGQYSALFYQVLVTWGVIGSA